MLASFSWPCEGNSFRSCSDPEVVCPRIPRLPVPETPTVYPVMSRTVLPGLPFSAADKEH